jgi:hypothetical protein
MATRSNATTAGTIQFGPTLNRDGSSSGTAITTARAPNSGQRFDSGGLLARAAAHATTTRDRQLVAIATAHLEGDHDLFDALIRATSPTTRTTCSRPGLPLGMPGATSPSLTRSRYAHPRNDPPDADPPFLAARRCALGRRLGRIAVAWPAVLAAIWALGWAITYAAGIEVNEQFTIFGSSGAVAVTALTAVLPVLLSTKEGGQS